MKIYNLVIIATIIYFLAACSDDGEFDNQLPASFDYISFESSSKTVLEGSDQEIAFEVTWSSTALPAQNTALPFSVTAPAGLRAAVEGVDYEMINTTGAIDFPANTSVTSFDLIRVLDNDSSDGARYLDITLAPVEGFIMGSPDDREAETVRVMILEDDFFTFGYTSFEEVPTFIGDIFYPKLAQVDQPNIQLTIPAADDPYVDFIALPDGMELGFDLSGDPNNLPDNGVERIGVFENANMDTEPADFETRFMDGERGYILSDVDGLMILTLDEVNGLSPTTTNAIVEITLYFGDTTYEPGDKIEVYFEVNGELGEPLLALEGDDIEDVAGEWMTMQLPIPDASLQTGRVVVIGGTTVNAEMIFIDQISVKGIQ